MFFLGGGNHDIMLGNIEGEFMIFGCWTIKFVIIDPVGTKDYLCWVLALG